MLKVDPKTNGSQHLSEGTEDIAPGASIPTHKHPTEDEVLLIHSGEAHVLLGEQERDLHAGGLVFIPANTWIGLKNISTEPLSVTFIFSAPGFEEIQRCISVPATKTPTQMTEDDLKRCEAPVSMEMALPVSAFRPGTLTPINSMRAEPTLTSCARCSMPPRWMHS